MTRFAISLWVWDETGQATTFALVAFFSFLPGFLFTPVAGALSDRWNKKLVMMLSDLGAGLATVALFLLALNGELAVWHIIAAGVFSSVFESFQFPAYSAAVSAMVEKEQYQRTSAMLGLVQSASGIIAPIAAAALYPFLRLEGIMLIDIVTFVFAVGSIALIHIPAVKRSAEGVTGKGSLWSESLYGFRYILARPSMAGLQAVFLFGNMMLTIPFVIFAPMILARTGGDEGALAIVNAALGIGGVVGGVLISTWGGFKRRVHGVLGGWIFASLGGIAIMGAGQTLLMWVIGAFVADVATPLINSSNQAIWQTKVPPDIQGRVFAARSMLAQAIVPLSTLISGPLADYVFEPAMQPDGAWAPIFGGLVGTGAGAGMALMFVVFGLLASLAGFAGYALPFIRNAESIVPDHDIERSTASGALESPAIPQ